MKRRFVIEMLKVVWMNYEWKCSYERTTRNQSGLPEWLVLIAKDTISGDQTGKHRGRAWRSAEDLADSSRMAVRFQHVGFCHSSSCYANGKIAQDLWRMQWTRFSGRMSTIITLRFLKGYKKVVQKPAHHDHWAVPQGGECECDPFSSVLHTSDPGETTLGHRSCMCESMLELHL